MGLKVELKPGERIIIGDSVITNDDQRTRLMIEGDTPILREKDILTVEQADTPCKKIYLVVQLMYLARDPAPHHDLYFQLVRDVLTAAPSTHPYFDRINNHILTNNLYKALKETQRLIEYEKELLEHAERKPGLRENSAGNWKSA
jgi:flagellar protein FlbT